MHNTFQILWNTFWIHYKFWNLHNTFHNLCNLFRNLHNTFRNLHNIFRNLHNTFRNLKTHFEIFATYFEIQHIRPRNPSVGREKETVTQLLLLPSKPCFVQRVETESLQVSSKFCPKCGKDLANNKERMWKTLSQVELRSVWSTRIFSNNFRKIHWIKPRVWQNRTFQVKKIMRRTLKNRCM